MLTAGTTTVSTAGTAVQLYSTEDTIATDIKIKALSTNSGLVYVGLSNVNATNGFTLVKGEEVTFDRDKDITVYYVDAAESGDKITWFADVSPLHIAP